LLESYGSKEDSRRQNDVLVPLETPYGETTEDRILIRCHQKWARRLGPAGLASRSLICLFRHLSTKTQPKCRLGPAGLAFQASQMPRPPLFRLLDVRLTVSDVPRSTPNTPSVKVCLTVHSCPSQQNIRMRDN